MKREIEFQELNDEQLDQVTGGGMRNHGGWHGWGHRSTNIDVNINVQTVIVVGNSGNVNVGQFSYQRA
jgi:bacteriocin-like protein